MPGLAGIWEPGADEQNLRRDLGRMNRILEVPSASQSVAVVAAEGIACLGLAHEATASHVIARREGTPVWLLFDGEIYNRSELVSGLDPTTFRGADSDADLCLQLLLEQGESFVGRLNGQFNLAVYRRDEGRLSIATDRFGYRPLFVARRGRRMVFATAIKALLTATEIVPEIDGIGILQAMRGGWPLGDRTWLEGVRLVPPGSWMHFTPERSWNSRYFRLRFEARSDGRSSEAHGRELAAKLTQAIQRRTGSGERVAVPLSGGLDSRALVLSSPHDQRPALTYTFGRAGSFDVTFGGLLARLAGVPHRHFAYEAGYLGTILPGVVWFTEGLNPFAHVTMGSLAFHQRIGAEADVLLYGHCGDCLTGAHLSPAILACRSRERLIERVFRQYNQVAEAALRRVLNSDFYRRYAGALFDAMRDTFADLDGDSVADIADVWDMENRQRRGTFGSTPVDRYRFEVRAPFLDNDVVDHLRAAPLSWRVLQTAYKEMHLTVFPGAADIPWAYTGRRLRGSLAGDFVQHAINYAKRRLPRRGPDPRSFRDLTADTRADASLARTLREFGAHDGFPAGVFDRKGIEQTVEDHWSGRRNLTHLVVMLATFATAWRLFLLAPPVAMPADVMQSE